ncbi:MAG TPA: patatin-like phospholipase family protein, partial [Armatimonadota bacterium]|nr:patatin-like phospholipase family protein [Armatimonadota bacterium]
MPPVGALGAEERPRLGLALSGGAALGLAHVGALVWLEENRVPVDYVAGASMGGLVGGLYAMG